MNVTSLYNHDEHIVVVYSSFYSNAYQIYQFPKFHAYKYLSHRDIFQLSTFKDSSVASDYFMNECKGEILAHACMTVTNNRSCMHT